MHNQSKVGIIIPAYNTSEYIEECIASINRQTHPNIIVSICVDGDKRTYDIANKAISKHKIYISQNKENLGWAKTTNISANQIKEENCDYLYRLDSDDVINSDCIDKLVKEIQNGYDWVCSYLQKFGENDDILSCESNVTLYRLLKVNPITCFALFKASVWYKFGGYDENLTPEPYKAGFEDWDLWIRLIKAGKKYSVIQEPLYKYRQHKEQFGNIANNNHEILYKILKDKHQ